MCEPKKRLQSVQSVEAGIFIHIYSGVDVRHVSREMQQLMVHVVE